MSEAMKLIVNGYVSLKNRSALEDLREHRQRLRKQLQEQEKGVFDVSHLTQLFDEELRVIEGALDRL